MLTGLKCYSSKLLHSLGRRPKKAEPCNKRLSLAYPPGSADFRKIWRGGHPLGRIWPDEEGIQKMSDSVVFQQIRQRGLNLPCSPTH